MRLRVLPAARPQPVEVGEREHVRQPEALDLRPLLVVLDEDAQRVGVLEDVRAVARGAGRVDGRPDRADEREGVVEEDPLEPGGGEDPERVALADAEREEAVRELVHRARCLGPRDLAPDPGLVLHEVAGAVPSFGDGVEPQPRDRAARRGGRRGLSGNGCLRQRR